MTLEIPPTGYEFGDARSRYVEQFGSTIVMNAYLRVALIGVSAIAVGLLAMAYRTQQTLASVKPLVIRIDEVGRATAVTYDSLTYKPQASEMKYFLIQFVARHYARLHATVRDDYAQSLFYLDGRLADAIIDANRKTHLIETFLAEGGEDIDIAVRNVTLEDLRQPPYRATVDFDKVYYSPADHAERRRETYVAHIVFVVRDRVPNALIPVNPLGLTITYFREDQAFK